jgi:hypothetical protein
MSTDLQEIIAAVSEPAPDGSYPTLRDKIRAEKSWRSRRYEAFARLVELAHLAGKDAATATVPEPMTVVQRANPLDDSSPVVKQYAPVAAGVCGFAWVTVRPATSSFARWAKDSCGWRKAYSGGVQLWVSAYGQSYERKIAYADAYAAVLKQAGITAYAGGRLD